MYTATVHHLVGQVGSGMLAQEYLEMKQLSAVNKDHNHGD